MVSKEQIEKDNSETCLLRYEETGDIKYYIMAWFYLGLENEKFVELCEYEFAYRDFEGLEEYFDEPRTD